MIAAKHSDKRERLVDAARELLRPRGYGETSLADIARESGVPVGNVYYYFKTKEDIAAAVIEQHRAHMTGIAQLAETRPTARERILSMLDSLACGCDSIAHSGCPMGSLCVEFGKRGFVIPGWGGGAGLGHTDGPGGETKTDTLTNSAPRRLPRGGACAKI